jgi:hypothetical protein
MANLLGVVLVPAFSVTLAVADVSGVWRLDFDPDFSGHRSTGECTFEQADTKLTGNCGTDSPKPTPISGEVKQREIVFHLKTGTKNEVGATFTAELDDQARTMKGRWRFVDGDGKEKSGRFQATKR